MARLVVFIILITLAVSISSGSRAGTASGEALVIVDTTRLTSGTTLTVRYQGPNDGTTWVTRVALDADGQAWPMGGRLAPGPAGALDFIMTTVSIDEDATYRFRLYHNGLLLAESASVQVAAGPSAPLDLFDTLPPAPDRWHPLPIPVPDGAAGLSVVHERVLLVDPEEGLRVFGLDGTLLLSLDTPGVAVEVDNQGYVACSMGAWGRCAARP